MRFTDSLPQDDKTLTPLDVGPRDAGLPRRDFRGVSGRWMLEINIEWILCEMKGQVCHV